MLLYQMFEENHENDNDNIKSAILGDEIGGQGTMVPVLIGC
jgi:hypothetical protein